MAVISNKDLEYQPKTDKFSFIDTKLKRKFRIKIFTLFLIVFIFTFLTLGYFLSLNYFRIIYLPNISPVFKSLPRSPYELEDLIQNYKENQNTAEIISLGENSFSASGKIDKVSEDSIRLRLFSGKTITLEITPETQIAKRSKDGLERELLFTLDLLQKENIGKSADAQFIKEKGKNTLTSVEIDLY